MGSSKSVDWDGSCILLLQVLGYHMASTCISVATEHVAVFAVAFIDTSKDPPQCSPWQTSGAKLLLLHIIPAESRVTIEKILRPSEFLCIALSDQPLLPSCYYSISSLL